MGDTIRYPNMGTVKKAAEIYGLSPAYIRRLCKIGKIRYVNAGHMWLVNLDSLARYKITTDRNGNHQPCRKICIFWRRSGEARRGF